MTEATQILEKIIFDAGENSILNFNTQEWLFLHFTVLGIFVTLFAISTVLTKEVRQDLIKDYYLSSGIVIRYIILLVLSFIISALAYRYKWPFQGVIAFCLLIAVFLYSICLIFSFLYRLNRNWLYSKMVKNFKKEVKCIGEQKSNAESSHTKTEIKALNDFLKNLSYVQTSSNDFTEEMETIKQFVKNTPQEEFVNIWSPQPAQFPFQSIENTKLLYELLRTFYDLKNQESKNLELTLRYQNVAYFLCEKLLWQIRAFDDRIRESWRLLRDFLNNDNIKTFKETTDEACLENYDRLIGQTISLFCLICKTVRELNLDDGNKKLCFEELINNLNNVSRLCNEYGYNAQSRQFEIITKQKKEIREKLSELFYSILSGIEQDELSQSFFKTAFYIYRETDFRKKFYDESFGDLVICGDNRHYSRKTHFYNKYRLLILLYEYIRKDLVPLEPSGISDLSEKDFSENSESLKESIELLNKKFIDKYFDIEENSLNEFKQNFEKEHSNEVSRCEILERNYYRDATVDEKYKNKFKTQYEEKWKEYQKEFSSFLATTEENEEKTIEPFKRDWPAKKRLFVNPYSGGDLPCYIVEKTVKRYAKESSEYKFYGILEKIDKLFNVERDTELIVKNLALALGSYIRIERDKKYFLFTDKKEEILNIPNLEWRRDWLVEAKLSLNGSEIFICHSNYPVTLLLEKDKFILKQYYSNIQDKEFVDVTISELVDLGKENLLNNGKNSTAENLAESVKISLSEYFKIERKDEAKLIRLLF